MAAAKFSRKSKPEDRERELSNQQTLHQFEFLLTKRLSHTSISFDAEFERKFFHNKRIHAKLRCGRDKEPTRIIEECTKILFKTSTFRADAVVTIPPLPTNRTYEVGWIQACNYIKFCNRYNGYGFSSWEFPQLNRGLEAVNDSSGEYFPFYGKSHEVKMVTGPTTQPSVVVVAMADSPSSQVTYKIPTSHIITGKQYDLTSVERRQRFFLWLVIRSKTSGALFPLRTIVWDVDINVAVNPNAPLGRMTKVLPPYTQSKPKVTESVFRIPPEALGPPSANNAQMLLWRPPDIRKGVSVIIFPNFKKIPSKKELNNLDVYTSNI